MSNVARNDLYARDEKGPEWFNEFLQSLAGSPKPSSVQEILSAINNKRGESVESVVQSYREQVGLDMVQSSDDGEETTVKQASVKFRPLSIRHAAEQSVVDQIQSNQELSSAIESLLRHSGGTKKIQSLIGFLRKELGNDVSFSDKELIEFLENLRGRFREALPPDSSGEHVGLVGTTDDSGQTREDDVADYIKNDGAK